MSTKKPEGKNEIYLAIGMADGFTYVGRQQNEAGLSNLEEVVVMETVSTDGAKKNVSGWNMIIKSRSEYYAHQYREFVTQNGRTSLVERLADYNNNSNVISKLNLGTDILDVKTKR